MRPLEGTAPLPLLLLFVLAAAGCASSSQRAPPTEPTGFGSGEDAYVLVWTDAALYRSKRDPVPLRAYDFGPAGRRAHPGEVLVGRLLEDDGDWLEIATGPITWLRGEADVHCAGSGIVEYPVTLRLWVHARDVAPVLQTRLARTFPDGSAVDLLPGTPILDRHPWVDGFVLPIEVPADDVGRSYHPLVDPRSRHHVGELAHLLRMDATLGGLPVGWAQPPWDYAKPPFVSLAEHGQHIRETNGCGTIELLFKGTVANDIGGGSFLLGDLASGHDDRATLAGGASLTWLDGSPAGELSAELRTKLQPEHQTLCFKVPLALEWHALGYTNTELTLCASDAARGASRGSASAVTR